jgi:hypothetical protein
MSTLVTWGGATSATAAGSSDHISGPDFKYINKVVQVTNTGTGTCTVTVYGSIDGGAHFASTAVATLSMGANDTEAYNSGATPCVYDTLKLTISGVSGTIAVSAYAKARRN